jgi:DNA-binding transcriptional MerR regulator
MKSYKIDEVSKQTKLTKRTIRYYEEIGLIIPPDRSEGGTRMYSEEDINKLKKIVLARDVLGFSLQELQEFVLLEQMVEVKRVEYHQALEMEKTKELIPLSKGLDEQIALITQKLKKMHAFKIELEELSKKIHKILDEGVAEENE